jgi:hypothetical protein
MAVMDLFSRKLPPIMAPAGAFHKGQYGLVNLRYHPSDKAMVGIEYQHGRRETFQGGFNASANKVQLSLQLAFSKVLEMNE